MKKIGSYLLISIAVICIVTISYGWITLLYPYKPMTVLEPYKAVEPVYAGEAMYYKVHIYKHLPVSCRVIRQLVDGSSIMFPPMVSNLPVGENNKMASLLVPDYVTPGIYTLHTTYEYDINFIRTVVIKTVSLPFTIHAKRKNLLK